MSTGRANAAIDAASDGVLALLAVRAPGTTICPSEVARALASAADPLVAASDWRDAMPAVHAAVDLLLAQAVVQLSWKGQPLAARAGPYRIGRTANR